jgi:light-regulated signal transduction histidine kinase (bacteriophytochrome)
MKTPSNLAAELELHNKITQLIQDVTGFNRVMIYAFCDNGDGEVLAEMRHETIYGGYLGLRFPASDIPQIARALYKKNPWRLIPDIQSQTILLLSKLPSPPDLTWSDLRSVSPVHQIYLANMGVRASLSLPIIVGGELWGLIACHHTTARVLPLKTMRAASQIAKHYALVLATWVAETRMRFIDLRIPRHSATHSTSIRPPIPRAFGHLLHEHSAMSVGAKRRKDLSIWL